MSSFWNTGLHFYLSYITSLGHTVDKRAHPSNRWLLILMASSGAHKEDLPADSVGPPAPGPRSWRPIELSPLTCWAQTALAPACSPAARHGRCSRCRTLWGTEHIILTHCRGRCNSVMGAFWLSYLLRASLLLVKHFTSKAEMALAASGISVLWCHSKRFLSSLMIQHFTSSFTSSFNHFLYTSTSECILHRKLWAFI